MFQIMISAVAAVWRWRMLIFELVVREFRSKYASSSIGSLWYVIQPLGLIIIYTFIFAELIRSRLPSASDHFSYSIHLCAGLLPWTLFADLLTKGSSMFLESSSLLKKSSVPKIVIPFVMILNALIPFFILMTIFLLWLGLFSRLPTDPLGLIAPLVILLLLGVGIGTFVGILNVFLRDVGQLVTLFLQFGFWLTPIVWPLEALPKSWQSIVMINPIVPLIQRLQAIFMGEVSTNSLLYPAVFAFISLLIAAVYFHFLGKRMIDEL